MSRETDLIDFAEEQLSIAQRSDSEVRAVLDVLEALVIDWPEVDEKWALNTCLTLLDGKSLPKPDQTVEEEHIWVPILLGDGTRPGHVVRVRPEAYSTPSGLRHNGRIGTFAGARNGYVYIKYQGETEDTAGAPHRPEMVEKVSVQE